MTSNNEFSNWSQNGEMGFDNHQQRKKEQVLLFLSEEEHISEENFAFLEMDIIHISKRLMCLRFKFFTLLQLQAKAKP